MTKLYYPGLADEARAQLEAIWQRSVEVAREHGYSLTFHGSVARDIDLVAVPWASHCSDQETVARAIQGAARESSLHGMAFDAADGDQGTVRPHGRRGWAFHLGGPYIDLSVVAPTDPALAEARARITELEAKLNTPELYDFAIGVVQEAAHQRERYGSQHDEGKSPLDWFWLLGFLCQKAAFAAIAGDVGKALHHCISSAAALANWHAALLNQNTAMRPGIAPPRASAARTAASE